MPPLLLSTCDSGPRRRTHGLAASLVSDPLVAAVFVYARCLAWTVAALDLQLLKGTDSADPGVGRTRGCRHVTEATRPLVAWVTDFVFCSWCKYVPVVYISILPKVRWCEVHCSN
jgi:hypothetical protein